MPLDLVAAPTSQEERLIDAALRCVTRWGVAKTTLDDVAREAGCSRATVYRIFPGGKEGLMAAVAATEVTRFFAAVGQAMDDASTLEDLLVIGMTEAGRRITGHKPLQYLLEHEPEAVLPRLAFTEMEQVLRIASQFAAPYLAPWIPDTDAALRAAEWVTRLVVSYALTPAEGVSIEDERSVRSLVQTFVLPGLIARRHADQHSGHPAPGHAAPGLAASGHAAPGLAASGLAAPGHAAPGLAASGHADQQSPAVHTAHSN